MFVLPHTAFAETKAGDDSTDSIVRDINGIFNTLLRMSSAWLWPVLIMTGSLLDNDLIFGGAMGERLLDIWVQIRNLVNIACFDPSRDCGLQRTWNRRRRRRASSCVQNRYPEIRARAYCG